ncbi:MAG: hypothetical protein JSV00_00825 [bacterium]|nr:MAG: hypothetical protein JSV00_00825 [bacterium]
MVFRRGFGVFIGALFLAVSVPFGCTGAQVKSKEAYKKGLEPLTEEGYVTPTKPVDRHYIGYAWSRQFGPVETSGGQDIRVRKDRSLDSMLEENAYKRGIALGGETILGQFDLLKAGSKGASQSQLSGLEIIKPVSLGDIPFEPEVMYVTEALRLNNFRIREEKQNEFAVGFLSTDPVGGGGYSADPAGKGRFATEGNGLVVGYRLHTVDMASYQKRESGSLPLELDKGIDLAEAGLYIKPTLVRIDPGAGNSLPRNFLWACPRADAMSRDMIAAWLVDIRSTDPSRKSLTIAFPAYPRVDDCQYYSGTIQSGIDPLTDRLIRQRIQVTILDAELTDGLEMRSFFGRISLVDESFKIKVVQPVEVENGSS